MTELEALRAVAKTARAIVENVRLFGGPGAAIGVLQLDLAALDAASDEWRDIATAPKDGTWLLLSTPRAGSVFIGFWWGARDRRGWYKDDDDLDTALDITPTHWRPLPAPPRAEPEEG